MHVCLFMCGFWDCAGYLDTRFRWGEGGLKARYEAGLGPGKRLELGLGGILHHDAGVLPALLFVAQYPS